MKSLSGRFSFIYRYCKLPINPINFPRTSPELAATLVFISKHSAAWQRELYMNPFMEEEGAFGFITCILLHSWVKVVVGVVDRLKTVALYRNGILHRGYRNHCSIENSWESESGRSEEHTSE